jgi:hypothetical protein
MQTIAIGRTVGEVEPEGRAAGEIRELWTSLRQRLEVSTVEVSK